MIRVIIKNISYYWRSTLSVTLILVMIGIACVYTLQTTEEMKIQADDQLRGNWRTGYDLLVSSTPEDKSDGDEQQAEPNVSGSSSSDVLGGLVRRSDMAQHDGGISLDQYEAIQAIEDIRIAAPMSFIGNIENDGLQFDFGIEAYGFYLKKSTTKVMDGIRYRDVTGDYISEDTIQQYISNEYMAEIGGRFKEILEEGGWMPSSVPMNSLLRSDGSTWSFAAVDPKQESKLLNVDEAVVHGTFFPEKEVLEKRNNVPVVPLILLNQPYDVIFNASAYEIDVPENMDTDTIMEKGGEDFLRTLPKEQVMETTFNPFGRDYLFNFGHIQAENGQVGKSEGSNYSYTDSRSIIQYSPLQFNTLSKSLTDDIPVVEALAQGSRGEQINYRNSLNKKLNKKFGFDVIGRFDSTLLENQFTTSEEPVPPDYYKPEDVYMTHNPAGEAYDEPIKYQSSPYKSSYYTGGIDAITTLTAAEYLLGEKPISVIRVIIDGAGERSKKSMAKVERIAQQIRDETGLQVDIMLGAANRKVHVLLDDYEGIPGYGYLLEGWSKEGASFVIEDRVSGTTAILTLFIVGMGLICLALVYRHYTENRQRDCSVQYTFGWSKWKIIQTLLMESAGILMLVFLCLMALYMGIGESWEVDMVWLAVGGSMGISILAILFFYIIPLIRFVGRNATLKGADNSKGMLLSKRPGQTLWAYVFRNMLRQPLRSMAKAIIIISTVFYISLFMIIKEQASSFLSLTFLGESIDGSLVSYQWVLFGMGLALALFSYIVININQTEARANDIQLFRAWGWQKKRWASLFLMEELVVSAFSAIIGVAAGYFLLFTRTDGVRLDVMTLSTVIFSGVVLAIFISACALLIRSRKHRLREFR